LDYITNQKNFVREPSTEIEKMKGKVGCVCGGRCWVEGLFNSRDWILRGGLIERTRRV